MATVMGLAVGPSPLVPPMVGGSLSLLEVMALEYCGV